MDKILECRAVGFDCTAVVHGPDEASVLAQAAAHAKEVHGVTDMTPEIVAKVKASIHDVPASR